MLYILDSSCSYFLYIFYDFILSGFLVLKAPEFLIDCATQCVTGGPVVAYCLFCGPLYRLSARL